MIGTLRWILIFSIALSVLMLALAACGGYDDQDIDRMLPIEASPEDFERVSRDTPPKDSELIRYISISGESEDAENISIQQVGLIPHRSPGLEHGHGAGRFQHHRWVCHGKRRRLRSHSSSGTTALTPSLIPRTITFPLSPWTLTLHHTP